MGAYYGIVPIRNIDRTICADGHITRPEPAFFFPVIGSIMPDIIAVGMQHGADQIFSFSQVVARLIKRRMITEDHIPAGIGAQQHP
jgi:hypothetical protein